MAVTGLVALAGALATGGLPWPRTAAVWDGMTVTAVLAGAFAYWAKAAVRRYLSGNRTAVIMTTESLFAARRLSPEARSPAATGPRGRRPHSRRRDLD